jgi:hypothetical protein
MVSEKMLRVVLTPPSVTQEENPIQWMKERIATFQYLISCFHTLKQEGRIDDLLWLLEQWGIAQKVGS